MKIDGVEVRGPITSEFKRIITPDSIRFATTLEREFGERLRELRQARDIYQSKIDSGMWPIFPAETEDVLNGNWQVASIPKDLERRWVEITGPASDRKMVINALNSGADVYMADSEDSESPAWENIVNGQINLKDAVDRTITFTTPKKNYKLEDKTATLAYRPRGLHLDEEHVLVNERPMSASLFDFAMYYYHNARRLVESGSGPYPYLPKAEHYKESAWWNDVIDFSEEKLDLKGKPTRATQLIETYPAAFQMPLMLHALREHSSGLNLGRWDLWFSTIKTLMALAVNEGVVFPGRSKLTMSEHFPKAACDLLVRTCHLHGAHAMGGMSAIVPDKESEAVLEKAIEAIEQDKLDDFMAKYNNTWVARIIEDKLREAAIHFFDGAWAAHPGMVKLIGTIFKKVLNDHPNQIDNKRQGVIITPADLQTMPRGEITEADLRENINIPIQYLESWLRKTGCVAISKKMEDLATAEMGRILLSHWLEQKAKLNDGRVITIQLVKQLIKEELATIKKTVGEDRYNSGKYKLAVELLEGIVNKREVTKFLGDVAYPYITSIQEESKTETKEEFVKRTEDDWKNNPRWEGIVRPYTAEDIYKLRGSEPREYVEANKQARKAWDIFRKNPVATMGVVSGHEATQMIASGTDLEDLQSFLTSFFDILYIGGWYSAADKNTDKTTYSDLLFYGSSTVPDNGEEVTNVLDMQDKIFHLKGNNKIKWKVPVIADGDTGYGDEKSAGVHMKRFIEANIAGVHFEDQVEKRCGHLGGKTLMTTRQYEKVLEGAMKMRDIMGAETLLIARTDAEAAKYIVNDSDERDREFIDYSKGKTEKGYFYLKEGVGLEMAIRRGLAAAPYADMIWFESHEPDLEQALKFAEAIRKVYPNKMLAYNLSPSFNWDAYFTKKVLAQMGLKEKDLGDAEVKERVDAEVFRQASEFIDKLGKAGYAFQFQTYAAFRIRNLAIFNYARQFRQEGMAAWIKFERAEKEAAKLGYFGQKGQSLVGGDYWERFGEEAIITGSTEEQFKH